jgi:uncharacterized protein
MLAHISSLAGFIIPFGNIIGPLIIWLVKKDTMPFVNDQGKESLNFQITVSIAVLICLALICVAGLGIILAPVVGIIALVFAIIGGVKASSGEAYRYPVAIRLIR